MHKGMIAKEEFGTTTTRALGREANEKVQSFVDEDDSWGVRLMGLSASKGIQPKPIAGKNDVFYM